MNTHQITYKPELPEWFQRRYPIGQSLEATFTPRPPMKVITEVIEHTPTAAILRVVTLEGTPDDNIIAHHLLNQINDAGLLEITTTDLIMMLSIFKPVGEHVLSIRERFPQFYPVTDEETIVTADRIASEQGCQPDTVIRAYRAFTGADRILMALLSHLSMQTGRRVTSLDEATELMAWHDSQLKTLPYECIKRDPKNEGDSHE